MEFNRWLRQYNMEEYFVYILECNDGSFYTGMTHDLKNRLHEHRIGYYTTCYTFKRRPVKLVWYKIIDSKKGAHEYERQIKGWSRQKKLALITGNTELLKELAKSTEKKSGKNRS